VLSNEQRRSGVTTKETSEAEYEQRWLELEAHLGRLVVAWSRVEFYVSRVFVGLADLNDVTATLLVNRLTGDGMTDIALGLLKHRPNSEAEPIKSWLKSVKSLREDRNRLFHGTLVDQSEGGQWLPTNISYRLDETGALFFGGTRLTTDSLTEMRARLYEVQRGYGKLPEVAWRGINIGD
jgi:hypothetical protein